MYYKNRFPLVIRSNSLIRSSVVIRSQIGIMSDQLMVSLFMVMSQNVMLHLVEGYFKSNDKSSAAETVGVN